MVEITLNVEGMVCEKCVAHVEEAAKSVSGVKSAVADKDKKTAIVVAKESTDVEQIKQSIVDAGYEVGDAVVKPIEKKGFFARFKK